MDSAGFTQKSHAVCIPYPAQGHVTPMLNLAKLLHSRGFHVTFVNTEFNHNRLLKSRGPDSLDSLPSFRFQTIPDGLPPSDVDATQDIPSLCKSTSKTCSPHFKQLLHKLNHSDGIPVTCIVSDGIMSFAVDAAEELGLPILLFWTPSACGVLSYLHYRHLIEKGLIPLKDESYLNNGYLDTAIHWIPGMKDIRLKDLPSFIRTTDPNSIMLDFIMGETDRAKRASAIVLNTFDALEHDVLSALSPLLPPIYPIGPLNFLANQLVDDETKQIGSNLWKEDRECLPWLDSKEANSVVYVNFGSITVVTTNQLVEFAWGLANSKKTFLWVIRPDLVVGDSAVLPPEFVEETKERCLLGSWCPQEEVLRHPSIGGFLTHSGWNSTIESICAGVPMICWPFFAEQQTNCRYCCEKWGIGMEINSDVNRDEVESLVRELMEGEKGKEMKKNAMEWKRMAEGATCSSCVNLKAMISKILLHQD
ncbi:7-deoxyloganetin glucosyltransferase-like [Carica papaya]|uniref:7-deoxyloganetin glucosyltransferase-like n=1 Tax=Carica papaya TaxID=3649 RepID=UPI000B8CFCC1|nr:7-deoxyloganetin glucosyltransferase-like [Carica papaya]